MILHQELCGIIRSNGLPMCEHLCSDLISLFCLIVLLFTAFLPRQFAIRLKFTTFRFSTTRFPSFSNVIYTRHITPALVFIRIPHLATRWPLLFTCLCKTFYVIASASINGFSTINRRYTIRHVHTVTYYTRSATFSIT